MNIFASFAERYKSRLEKELTLEEYLTLCKEKKVHASIHERLLVSIGEPKIFDTRTDEQMSRIFFNRKVKLYPEFSDFYGIEETIEQIVAFLKHAAQGLEESKSVLYLLGPVGSAKSSIAERIKELAQKLPIYTIKAYNKQRGEWQVSPIWESPLGLFDKDNFKDLEEHYGITARYAKVIPSPWAVKRLKETNGDITQFKVVEIYPSILSQIGITKVEPGDDNNQDISSLVGKVNIKQLEDYNQNDPDAYNWAGGLNVATQGVMEFVEMFKAPIKMLHPLLTATQEGHYNGTEQFGAIPFQGLILAHSNETEWQTFRNNKANEAFLDRVYIVKVPYCLRVSEEVKIYKKLIANSELKNAHIAPGTLEMLAQFSVLTRLVDPENSHLFAKMEIYDGKNLKDKEPKAKSYQEYRETAGVNEGMSGSSTRVAYKILSKVFNYDADEIAANPIHLMAVLSKRLLEEQLAKEEEEKRQSFISGILAPKYAEFLGEELQKAYIESYHEYGQNLFDRYIQLADCWIQDKDYRDPDTGEMFDREALNADLEKTEKPAGITNAKDFRNETVGYVIRHRANNNGNSPNWTNYEKLRQVIEKRMFSNTEDLLPVITFTKKANTDEEIKHNDFVSRMKAKGYTDKQVRLAVEWFLRYSKNH